jgi:hypothetical protein
MIWKFYSNAWHDDQHTIGAPAGLPARYSVGGVNRAWKDQDTYEDGVAAAADGPDGYTLETTISGSVWLKNPYGNLAPVALDHLVSGALDYSHSSWHLSEKITGAGTSKDTYYLHETKNTLYLLDQRVGNTTTHTDGTPMIEIIGMGSVKDNFHNF